jgi:hypothetical protein
VAVAAALAATGPAAAEPILGLNSDNQLVRFDSATPGVFTGSVNVTGVAGTLRAIDFRPATGGLYGLGVSGATGQLYLINPTTGTAAALGAEFAVGGSVGFDFNPTVDRIRVVSGVQNLRFNPDTGALVSTDGNLNYAASTGQSGTPNGVATAYLNNDNNPATGTTQYTIDAATGRLFIQNPPNDGTLTGLSGNAAGGPLGVGLSAGVGFDISGLTGTAFLANGGTLFTVNLNTGAATPVGELAGGLIGIAAPVAPIDGVAPIPEPSTLLVFGLSAAGLAVARRRSARGPAPGGEPSQAG